MTEATPAAPLANGGPAETEDHAMYATVAARETQIDATMWQVPSMSLAGQAFLMTIALGTDSTKIAHIIASFLGAVVSLLSMQLMARLRRINISCAQWLAAYEVDHFGNTTHARVIYSKGSGGPLANMASFRVWMAGLAAFGVASLLILILAVFAPSVLG